jgi:tetratricopeptide (TPR) repeat protein
MERGKPFPTGSLSNRVHPDNCMRKSDAHLTIYVVQAVQILIFLALSVYYYVSIHIEYLQPLFMWKGISMPFRKTKPKDGQFLVGRDNQLRFFRDAILKPEDPEHNILSISGQGGVGKSTLLRRFLDELRLPEYHEYCLAALVNERQTTPASVMERFADQLREQGHPLKKFDDALTHYKEAVLRIQMSYRDEQEGLVRDVVDVVGSAIEDIPFAGSIVHKGATVFSDIMIERGRMRQFLKDAARLEDPIADLTGAFVRDLNQLTDTLVPISGTWNKRSRRIILCFDTFEQLAPDIAPWLLDHFLEQDVSANIVLVIAGRDSIEASIPDDPKRWLPLLDSGAIYLLSLNVFTEEETRIYLEKRGITDVEQMQQIRQLSRGLPLYLSMLTTNPDGHIDPTAGVVENFLLWIPKQEAQKRQLALNAALFSLPFTKDDIAAFAYAEPERTDLYNWLIGQSFVQYSTQDGRHIYHDIARDLFRRHLYQRSQEDYYAARKALAYYYKKKLEALQAEGNKSIYKSRSWQELVLALIQQVFLLPDEENHLLGIEYVLRMHEYNWRDDELIRILNSFFSNDSGQQVTVHVQSIVKQLLQYMELNPSDHYQQWVAATDALLGNVLRTPIFPSDVIAYLYRRKGRACRILKNYQIALNHFNYAIVLLPNYAKIYNSRGLTYRLMERYEEALTDFDRVLTLDENDAWVFAQRGETYRLMKRYEEAVTDFDKAIALDKNETWILYMRGQTYKLMGRYEETLTDFTRVITLDEKYKWAFAQRGETYRLMKRYEEAVTDFDRAIALDENYAWAFALRGEMYRQMKRYEEAVTDFDRAIALDKNEIWTLYMRGETYRLMGRYEEALTNFGRTIVLDENYKWAFVRRGQTYKLMERYEEALTDFTRAIALDEKYKWAFAQRGETYRLMKRYEEALADFDKEIALGKNSDWKQYDKALIYLLTDQQPLFHDAIHAALDIARSQISRLTSQDNEYYRLEFNAALYLLVDGSTVEAESEYRQLLSECSFISRLQAAASDIEEFLTIQPMNEVAREMLVLVKKRIEEMKL